MWILVLFTSLFLVTPNPILAQSPTMLKGHVEHQESMPPLEASLRAGNSLDAKQLKLITPNNIWCQIPPWMAGKWKTTTNTTYFTHNFQTQAKTFDINTFNCRSLDSLGWQKDRKGEIWEYSRNSFTSFASLDDTIVIQLTRCCEFIDMQPLKTTVYFRSIHVYVSKYSKRIARSDQRESIQTYIPFGNNLMKIDCSIKVFDDYGHPVKLIKTLSIDQRISPFKPKDVYEGKNMRELFREYLINHNLADLVPIDSTNSRPPARSKHKP